MPKKNRRIAAVLASAAIAVSALPASLAADAGDYCVGGNGTAVMEYLDRGIYAVNTGAGMFVSWRWNANDADDAEFRLYRDDTLIYTSTSGKATSYLDAGGNVNSKYRVDCVENGEVVTSDLCKFSSGTNYFDIPMDVPKGGTLQTVDYTYSPNDCCVGDVDGDGQYEIFVKWDPSNSKDNSQITGKDRNGNQIWGMTGNVYIDCYTLSGQKLWRIDLGRNIRAGQHYTQMCVADFDCDGKAELITKTCDGTIDGQGKVIGDGNALYVTEAGTILTGPEYLTLFEGATGAMLDNIDFPVPRGVATGDTARSTWGDNYGNRCERMNSAIAYLDGVHPSAIYGRGYYTRLTLSAVDVRDKKLVKRWIFDTGFNSSAPGYGCGNHNVMVADGDNDGKQEIYMGACAINDDGKLMWTTGQMHGDAMHLGDLDPDRAGQELFICHEDGNYGCSLVDASNGDIIFHHDGNKDTGRCCADNIWSGNKGAEFWAARPANTMMNSKGQTIGSKVPAMNFLIYWDGDLEREVQSDVAVTKMTAKDKYEDIFVAADCASNNGTKAVPCMTADLFGDWREELLLRTEDNKNIRVFCTTEQTDVRLTTLMHDMQYRMQNGCQQSSYNQPPHTSYYLGSDAPLPPRPQIQLNNTPPEPEKPMEGRLIKELWVEDTANKSGWKLSDGAAAGSVIFGDRDYTYLDVPEEIAGAEMIQTACNSKNTDAQLANFAAGQDIDVYIALDQRVEANSSIPAWISGYTKTGKTVQSSNDVTFDLYKATFKEGETIALGTNGMNGNVVNYTVFVTEAKTEPDKTILWGDANCDGSVGLNDAVAILMYVANQTRYELSAQGMLNADVADNGTSGVTAIDALSIQMADAGLLDPEKDWPITSAEMSAKKK